MGTRNLTMVVHNGQTKVAQYGQWDGYPSGQGATALKFLKKADLDKFKKRLESCRFFTPEDEADMKSFCASIGSHDGWLTQDQAAKYHAQYPFLSRDHGANILNLILNEDTDVLLSDSTEFGKDEISCEWAYIIDLDTGKFTVYGGTISPKNVVKVYDIDNLPKKSTFLKECEQIDND